MIDHFLVDFVLKDPRQKEPSASLSMSPHCKELDVVPKPWNKSFLSATTVMRQQLFVTNPTLNQVLNLWYPKYSSTRLINGKALLTHPEVLELTTYQSIVVKEIESVKNILLKRYYKV